MATTGYLKIIATYENGKKEEKWLYRCCDFFIDEMKTTIQEAFIGFQRINAFDVASPIEIVCIIYAEAYGRARARTKAFHVCISPFWKDQGRWHLDGSHFLLDVSSRDQWIFMYVDYDEDDEDKEIIVKEILTKSGWEKEIVNPSRRDEK